MRLFYLRLLCVLCLDLWFCFALCQRIFDCGLRNFAPAGATSPFQSQRAGPQRFLVLVRIWRCCSLEYKKQKENRKSSSPVNQKERRTALQFSYQSKCTVTRHTSMLSPDILQASIRCCTRSPLSPRPDILCATVHICNPLYSPNP